MAAGCVAHAADKPTIVLVHGAFAVKGASHVVIVSHPGVVADLIASAAQAGVK